MVKKALLIGINYIGTNNALQGCIQDVYNMREILKTYFNYEDKNIRLLSDKDQIVPTKTNIINNINWLISGIVPGDILFFHYSGHGSNIRDANNDETDRMDEVLVPLDFNTQGFITDDWLYTNFICKIPKNVSLWALSDSCHSGTIFDLKYNYKSLCKLKQGTLKSEMAYKSDQWTDTFSYSIEKSKDVQGNICMFSGCMDPQTSADAYEEKQFQGAFTYCFLKCLKNRTIESDGKKQLSPNVKLRDILKEVNCLLKINGYTQCSQLSLSKQTDLEKIFMP